jgi:hypothetical protein
MPGDTDERVIFRGVLIGCLCAFFAGAIAFLLRNPVIFNGYIQPGVLIGENFLRLIGAQRHIIPEGTEWGVYQPLLPVMVISFAFWSALLATIYIKRSWTFRSRIVLAVLSVFLSVFFRLEPVGRRRDRTCDNKSIRIPVSQPPRRLFLFNSSVFLSVPFLFLFSIC